MPITAGSTATADDVLALATPDVLNIIHLAGYVPIQFTSDVLAKIGYSGTTISLEIAGIGIQQRNTTSDWASAAAITSVILEGIYLYMMVRDASNNYRIYRYTASTLAGGGTLMTISGQSFSTTGGTGVKISSNGTGTFYVNFKGSTSANDYILSKYTLSGTTLTYSADVTCGSTTTRVIGFAIDSSGNIYAISSAGALRKYNSSGTLQYTGVAYGGFYGADMSRLLKSFYIPYADGSNVFYYYSKVLV